MSALLVDALDDIEGSTSESDYVAVNSLWLALVKLANREQCNCRNRCKCQNKRIDLVIQRIAAEDAQLILVSSAVDALLNLDPPLGSVLGENERSRRGFQEWIAQIRASRPNEPVRAILALVNILREVRNAREHGFKTRSGPRDREILRPARIILDMLCRSALNNTESHLAAAAAEDVQRRQAGGDEQAQQQAPPQGADPGAVAEDHVQGPDDRGQGRHQAAKLQKLLVLLAGADP